MPSHASRMTSPGAPWSSMVRGLTPAGAASAAASSTASARAGASLLRASGPTAGSAHISVTAAPRRAAMS